MIAPKPYKTLMKRADDQFIVNKSRFIGHGCPCETEEEALAFLAEIRKQYADASHNCYAYIIGKNAGIMRYSDDGEPSGTAGMPIIEVMKAREVVNACVIVTRYFGGVLLGAGGLIRAYAEGAKVALDASIVGVMHPTARYIMDVSYPALGKIEHHLKDQPVIVEEKAFGESIMITLIVKCADEDDFVKGIVDISEGRIEPIRMDELFLAWIEL